MGGRICWSMPQFGLPHGLLRICHPDNPVSEAPLTITRWIIVAPFAETLVETTNHECLVIDDSQILDMIAHNGLADR